MSDMNEWNQRVIEEFRANDGKVGGDMEGWPLLLLHHTGAKSGTERVTPLVYQRLGETGAVAVFASKAGAPTSPDWYHNLVAHPATTIELGAERVPRGGSSRDRRRTHDDLGAAEGAVPNFAEYEAKTTREIPVVVLDRAD